eukprot:gene1210-1629_t
MKLPRYELVAEQSLMVYEFISEGPKGQIPKLIKFSETALKGFYNLAFGDKDLTTGEIDDKAVSNNGDSRQLGVRYLKYKSKDKTLPNGNRKIFRR